MHFAGFACPLGTGILSQSHACASPTLYCPEGSAVPIATPIGLYAVPNDAGLCVTVSPVLGDFVKNLWGAPGAGGQCVSGDVIHPPPPSFDLIVGSPFSLFFFSSCLRGSLCVARASGTPCTHGNPAPILPLVSTVLYTSGSLAPQPVVQAPSASAGCEHYVQEVATATCPTLQLLARFHAAPGTFARQGPSLRPKALVAHLPCTAPRYHVVGPSVTCHTVWVRPVAHLGYPLPSARPRRLHNTHVFAVVDLLHGHV